MAWPDFFIVGCEKGGTTSLWEYMRQHPKIWFPEAKELNLFAGTPENGTLSALGSDGVLRSELEYQKLYDSAPPESTTGDASPSYLGHPEAASRIYGKNSDAKIIVLLRDPVARAHSAWHMRRRAGSETRSFEQAVDDEMSTEGPYLGLSKYSDAMQRYSSFKSVHIDTQHRLAANPLGVLTDLSDFLGINPGPFEKVDTSIRHNVARAPRNKLGATLLRSGRAIRLAKAVLPLKVLETVGRRTLWHSGREPISKQVEKKMRAYFDEDLKQVERQLDRPMPELRGKKVIPSSE